MKNISLLLCGSLLFIAEAALAETLFGTGTITIPTNQTVLITTLSGNDPTGFGPRLFIDGIEVTLFPGPGDTWTRLGLFAITGPHNLLVTNLDSADFFVSFQRITNSPIRTVVTGSNSTNFINVPTAKTIQLLPPLGDNVKIMIQPQNSTNWFTWDPARSGFTSTSITGPAMIAVAGNPSAGGIALSYYFTDDVVQFPPSGLLNLPAPILEVNIEKSYDLTNWTPTATFHTDAEAKAFYRLRLLK